MGHKPVADKQQRNEGGYNVAKPRRSKPLPASGDAERCNMPIGGRKQFARKRRKRGANGHREFYNTVFLVGAKPCGAVAVATTYNGGKREHRCLAHVGQQGE